jgi:H+/Cl- antiporter ClcA
MGGLFARSVVAVARGLPGRAGSLIRQHPILFAALCGLLVAVIGIVSGGTTYGTGYHEAKELLQGAGQIPASFGLLKMLATILCSVSGIPGGIFSPSLAVGAGFGANVAALLPHAPLGAVVLLGMAAYFAGVVQAPITAFVIVLEMTDNHAMAIPVMAAALIGYGTSRLSGAEPIYHALAEGFMPETGEGARPQASGHSP